MSELAPGIKEKYQEHNALVEVISKTEYALPSYKSNEDRIRHLQEKLEKKKKRLDKLKVKTQSEFMDVQELKRSATRRFMIRIKSGKEGIEKQTAKEEEEYLEAYTEEHNAKSEVSVMERELVLAIKARDSLKGDADKYTEAQKKLDELYEELFAGTTRDFPEEDEAEEAVKAARAKYADAQTKLNRESQVNAALKKASKAMKKTCKKMEKAEEYSLRDITSFNPLYVSFEREELHSAKSHAAEAGQLVKEAQELEPNVRELPRINIPFVDDAIPINPSNPEENTNVRLHRSIAQGVKDSDRYLHKLTTELERSDDRLEAVTKETMERQSELQKARKELDDTRRSIFERVHHGHPKILKDMPWVPSGGAEKDADVASLPEYYAKDPTFPTPNAPGQQPHHRPSLPAGGFKDNDHDSIVIGDISKTPMTPIFPEGPAFSGTSFPANPPQHIPPGFRVAAMEADLSKTAETIDDVSFPKPDMGQLNPYAAFMLMHANDSDSGDEDQKSEGSPKMPGSMPSLPSVGKKNSAAKSPATPSGPAPSMPSGPAPSMPSGPAPSMPSGPAPAMPSGPAPQMPTGPAASVSPLVAKMKSVSLKEDQQMLKHLPAAPPFPSAPSGAAPATTPTVAAAGQASKAEAPAPNMPAAPNQPK